MKMAPSSKDKAAAVAAAAAARPAQEAVQKCPRCDSANTKFCYYNNYSLSQPRHFCKTCRRYWTKGGALRNVPVGGGCRKNKRSRNSAASSSGTSSSTKDTDIGALKFFQSFTPAMDFNLAGLNNPPKPFGSAFLDISSSGGSGLSFPFPPLMNKLPAENLQMGPPPPQLPSLASSIESLSYINQDLHWKLQQQRLTLLFGAAATPTAAADQNQIVPFSGNHHHQEKPSPQPLMFHNLEIGADHDGPKPNDDHQHHHILGDHNHQIPNDDDSLLNSRTEWFFDSCYAPVNPNPATNVNNPNPNDGNSINWNGMPAWSPYSGI